MDNQVYNQIVSFIWGIADDCLRDVYVRGKYRDVILPMTVIRRLDAVLEDTKDEVLRVYSCFGCGQILHYRVVIFHSNPFPAIQVQNP